MTFAESVHQFAEEDAASSSSEKVAVSEGHRNVLRLLYQLCPGAAPKSPPAPRKVCDFEGLFASTDPSPVLEGPDDVAPDALPCDVDPFQLRFRIPLAPSLGECSLSLLTFFRRLRVLLLFLRLALFSRTPLVLVLLLPLLSF